MMRERMPSGPGLGRPRGRVVPGPKYWSTASTADAEQRAMVGRYARGVELIFDEVVRVIGENNDRPRLVLATVRRWSDASEHDPALAATVLRAETRTVRWSRSDRYSGFAGIPRHRSVGLRISRATAWSHARTAVANVISCAAYVISGEKPMVLANCCYHALFHIGVPLGEAYDRVDGELRRLGVENFF